MEETEMKRCPMCNLEKPTNEFSRDKSRIDGLSCYCKMCKSELNLLPVTRKRRKEYDLKRRYGVTLEQKQKMIEDQDGKCAICAEELDRGKDTHLDHDHKTGKIREILCVSCNHMIGGSKDNQSTLQKGIEYLRRNK